MKELETIFIQLKLPILLWWRPQCSVYNPFYSISNYDRSFILHVCLSSNIYSELFRLKILFRFYFLFFIFLSHRTIHQSHYTFHDNFFFPSWTAGQAARKIGFPVLYGDGSRPDVLHSAGVSIPKAFMIMYTGKKKTIEAVQRLRLNFPAVIISFPPPSCLNWLCVRACMCTRGGKIRVSIIESNYDIMMWLA